jgi:hypothetical protein
MSVLAPLDPVLVSEQSKTVDTAGAVKVMSSIDPQIDVIEFL